MNLNTSHHLYKTLADTAEKWPENLAIADEYGALTYAQLYKQTEALKDQLFSLGLRKNSSLTIIFKNSRYFVIALYAGMACECVVMPLPHYQKEDEIKRALEEANIDFILSDDQSISSQGEKIGVINSSSHPLYFYQKVHHTSKSVSGVFPGAAVMRFTSGTTGDAKCVVLSHQTILERIQAANDGLELCETDRVTWVLPMAYHFVVSVMLYVRYGCGIIISDDFMAENILDKAVQYKSNFLYASPVHIRLLAAAKENTTWPQLRRVISTTTAITPSVCKAFEEKYKVPVSQAFGIIEVGLPIINFRHSSDHPGAVGFGLPSFTISVLDDELLPLPADSIGHLAIKGPGMFDGYLSPLTFRDDVLKKGWFITGDLASMTVEGLIEIKGRSKNVINVSGNKVFPNEIEDVINLFPGIIKSKVYSYKHALMGEIVAADVILEKTDDFDDEVLINHCRKFLSSFKIPHRITVVDFIEMTASGKIKRA